MIGEKENGRFDKPKGAAGKSMGSRYTVRICASGRCRRHRGRPAVDAAPVARGEWIELHEENGHEVGTCSHCRHVRIVDNYCPNCGAKMDGGNDND